MVYRKRKKRKMGTHGHGSRKKWRGHGNKSGTGRAGLGKKAQHRKFEVTKMRKRKGFKSIKKLRKEIKIINLGEIMDKLDFFKEKGFIEEKNGLIIFDSIKAGYDKVLGKGNKSKPLENLRIKAEKYSRNIENLVIKE